MQKFVLFLLFEVAEFMCVNIVRQKLANLRIILYKECNKCDVTEQSASWDTVLKDVKIKNIHVASIRQSTKSRSDSN